MLITDLATTQAIGATATENLLPVKTALNATTSAMTVTWKLTLGGFLPLRSTRPRLYFACSPFSVAAAAARATFHPQAEFVELLPSDQPAGATVGTTDFIVNTGTYLYTWIDTPALGAAGTVDLKLVELN